jgi:hypothetical protein
VFILDYFYILPLHVSEIVGHLQAKYTIILGNYFKDKGSVVLSDATAG